MIESKIIKKGEYYVIREVYSDDGAEIRNP